MTPYLPDSLGPDLAVLLSFGTLLVLLLAFGVALIDRVWRRVDLQAEVAKGNVAAGAVMASCVLGLCYALGTVARAVLGS